MLNTERQVTSPPLCIKVVLGRQGPGDHYGYPWVGLCCIRERFDNEFSKKAWLTSLKLLRERNCRIENCEMVLQILVVIILFKM